MLDIQIIPAQIEEQPVIKQLLELYTYEMTDLADFDINDNGYFGYVDLPKYWQDPNRYPYIVKVNKKLAGFVLIQKGSPLENDPEIWDVAEFFIMRKFRKNNVGQFVAQKIWHEFNGRWQVRVWDNNTIAHAFWETVIGRFLNKPIQPKSTDYQGNTGLLIYKFNSSSEKP